MNSDKDDEVQAQIRCPRPRSLLQFYVDLFMTSCPQHCKSLSMTVIPDPQRRNGCNWQLLIHTPADKADQEFLCRQHIEEDMRLLYSVFDLEAEQASEEQE